jgi:hypothetical protein
VQIHELDAEWHLGKGKRVRLEDTFFDSADREEQESVRWPEADTYAWLITL